MGPITEAIYKPKRITTRIYNEYAEKEGEISKARFDANIMPVTESGCWIWMGTLEKRKNGYGRIQRAKTRISEQTHRASWEIYRGPIPAGKWVLHKCDVGACVNPDHLYLGTPKENTRDRFARGRDNIKRWDDACRYGHPRTLENVYSINGRRYCRVCMAIKKARYEAEGRYKPGGKYYIARQAKDKT